MYKLMVVDDEQIVIQGVRFIIDKYMEQVEVIEVARSGREAIEKIEDARPHIILMDIRMPGINGIEAIREIKKRDPAIKFIIVSAYEQFEFAKEAVALGVTDYIIKPVNRFKLVETIKKTIEMIKKEKDLKKRELETIEKINKVTPMLENGFIYSIMMNQEFEDEINLYRELFDIKTSGGYMVVIQFGEGDDPKKQVNKIGAGIQSQKIYESVKEILKYKTKCIVGPIIVNRLVIFIPSYEHEEAIDEKEEALHLLKSIGRQIELMSDVNFFIGIGSYKSIEQLYGSYDEALKALWYNNGERYLHIMDVSHYYDKSLNKLKDLKENIIRQGKSGNLDQMTLLGKEYIHLIDSVDLNTKAVGLIQNQLLEMLVVMNREAMDLDVVENMDKTSYSFVLDTGVGLTEVVRRSINTLLDIVHHIEDSKTQGISTQVKEAITFINGNYKVDLNLEDVANNVAISPQYFSKVFKEETGRSFIEYLTHLRLEEAKKLLKENNLSIKEICFEVGYKDPNYFSRLFKKQVGCRPTEYVKEL